MRNASKSVSSKFAALNPLNRRNNQVSVVTDADADSNTFSSALTAFELKRAITSKQLQNEEISALTVCHNLIYLATKSGKMSIFEDRSGILKHKKSIV